MTSATLSITSGFKLAGRLDLTGTGVTAPGVNSEQWGRARWATGAGPAQVDTVCQVERTLAAGAFEELDLWGGAVLDSGGLTVATLVDVTGASFGGLQALKGLQVQLADGAGGVRVGGAATDPHTLWLGGTAPTLDLDAGGPPVSFGGAAGKAVTAAARRVRLLHLDGVNPVTVRVALGGVKR